MKVTLARLILFHMEQGNAHTCTNTFFSQSPLSSTVYTNNAYMLSRQKWFRCHNKKEAQPWTWFEALLGFSHPNSIHYEFKSWSDHTSVHQTEFTVHAWCCCCSQADWLSWPLTSWWIFHPDSQPSFVSPVFSGQSVEAASDLGLAYMKSRVGGLGGVVTVDPQGHWAARFSSLQMAWAAVQKDTLHYGLYAGEHFTQNNNPHW